MLKKVVLTNIHSGKVVNSVVVTDNVEKALIGAGKTSVESAEVKDVVGFDATIQGLSAKKVSLDDRVALFGGLARCLERNLPIIKSFHLQASRVKSPLFKGAIADIADDLAKGEKMSDSIQKKHHLFTNDVIALIRAGEESGRLPEVFRRIAHSQKKSSRIAKKLKTGMIYPGVVIFIGIAVVIAMSFTLVPAMSKLYASLDTELPTATKIMVAFSNLLLKQPYLAAAPVIGAVMFVKNWGKINRIQVVQDILLKTPTVGNIIRKSASAVGFRTLALLIEANVRMSTALEITADTCWHYQYRKFFLNIKEHVINGRTLPDSFLIESHLLGDDGRLICGLMEVAAETGAGTELLNEIADDYEEELDGIANQIDKLIEPITIVLLGGLVAGLVYAIYAPVFSLGDALLK